MSNFGRRKFIAACAAVAAGAGAGAYWWYRGRGMQGMPHGAGPQALGGEFPNPLRVPAGEGVFGVLDADAALDIAVKKVELPIVPGKPAPLLAYEVAHRRKTYFNPVLRLKTGASYTAKLFNALDEETIIHWHGMLVDARNDGHPRDAVGRGAAYDYKFKVANRAGTYWYHPHPHGITGRQTYLGLASLLIVEDEEELALQKALDLTLGASDIPLLIQDKRIGDDGFLRYDKSEDDWFAGFLGERILVNLTARPHFNAATRIYRFRILNGTNARVYRLAFVRGAERLEFHVVGTDGGLLERPYRVREAFLSPAERLDVLLDLGAAAPGDTVMLRSLQFDPMHLEVAGDAEKGHDMSRMGAGAAILPDGAAFDIMQIRVTQQTRAAGSIPDRLSAPGAPGMTQGMPRVFTLDQRERRWRINGLVFDMHATPVTVKRGASEIWEIRNAKASMPHPMHLHGFQFQVLHRAGSPEQVRRLAIDERGLAPPDLGFKDTVLVWPGETVRFAVHFSHPFDGDQVYLFHCHNLEHEDRGMMINYRVAT